MHLTSEELSFIRQYVDADSLKQGQRVVMVMQALVNNNEMLRKPHLLDITPKVNFFRLVAQALEKPDVVLGDAFAANIIGKSPEKDLLDDRSGRSISSQNTGSSTLSSNSSNSNGSVFDDAAGGLLSLNLGGGSNR